MTFQHLGEAAAHFGGRLADRDGAGDVSRAVGILATRIDQIEGAGLDGAIGRFVDLVMRQRAVGARSEEHTSELQSLMRISYAVFCLKKKKYIIKQISSLFTLQRHCLRHLFIYYTS